jgi:Tfp pilus assembly protein PilO
MTDIHPIKPPLEVNLTSLIIFSVIILIIVIVLIFLLYKTHKRQNVSGEEKQVQEVKIDYKKIAIKRIKLLSKQSSPEKLRSSFNTLSFYVKDYLKSESNKNVVEMTAREIHHTFNNSAIDDFLKTCYRGEFMKSNPKLEEFDNAIDMAYKIINEF